VEKIKNALDAHALRMLNHHQTKTEEAIIGTWRVIGSPRNHEKFVDKMVKDKAVKEFTY
jgi:putative Mg2+ transporter-C (MgtC) family protein